MAEKRISELTAKGSTIAALDLVPISEWDGVSAYVSKTVTGAQLAAPDPNIQTVTSAATVTPTTSNDLVTITAQAVGLTIANPTGTPVNGKSLMIRIKDNATARTIAYGAKFRAIGVTLPTTTVISKTTYLGCIYNLTDDTYDVIGVVTQA